MPRLKYKILLIYFAEELKLQRNLESYDLLWRGAGASRDGSGNSQALSDRRDFAITKVGQQPAVDTGGHNYTALCLDCVLMILDIDLNTINISP